MGIAMNGTLEPRKRQEKVHPILDQKICTLEERGYVLDPLMTRWGFLNPPIGTFKWIILSPLKGFLGESILPRMESIQSKMSWTDC